jgi:hypothetical protein
LRKNRLEQKRVHREEVEIDDFHAEREKRLREQEEQENLRYQEQVEADLREREKAAAGAQRRQFISAWIEYALRQKPYSAPTEVELDIHEQVLGTLEKVDANERDSVVRRLVDGAVERGLRPWNTETAKVAALKAAVSSLPYGMRWNDTWKHRATRAAIEALENVRPGASRDEFDALTRAALEPLTLEFELAQRVENAINSVSISGANRDELSEAHEVIREALADLPVNSTDRQIMQARERTIKPLADSVAARLATEQRRR